MIRSFTLADLKSLEGGARFPLENLRHKSTLLSGSVESRGKLVCSFLLQGTTELALLFNPNSSRREKLLAVKEFAPELESEGRKRGILETHAFCDPIFARILVNHFGFEYCTGSSLVWRSRDGKESD